jgi:hypothetical protein
MNTITSTDIAGIYGALGDTYRAEQYRYLDRPDPDEPTVAELDTMLDQVGESVTHTKTHKGNKRWTTCAACLAERIREVLAC